MRHLPGSWTLTIHLEMPTAESRVYYDQPNPPLPKHRPGLKEELESDSEGPEWPGICFAIVALICAVFTLLSVMNSSWGVASLTRVGLGILGVGGSICLFRGNPNWQWMLVAWAALQIPALFVDPSGNLFDQGLWLGFRYVKTVRMNNVIASMSGVGVNLAGVILLIWIGFISKRGWHPPLQ